MLETYITQFKTFFLSLDWYYYTIMSMIIYGIINFMYKVAAHYKCSSPKIVNRSATTISILSLIIILISKSEFTNIKWLMIYAAINSSFFAIGSISKINALKFVPSSIGFPITKLNGVFLILISIIYFGDKPTTNQWIAIIISISMLFYISIFLNENRAKVPLKENKHAIGVFLAIVAALSTSVSMLTGREASKNLTVNKLNYVFISYTLVMLYTFLINRVKLKDKWLCYSKKENIFGAIIGILNFVGYMIVLFAFSKGPLAIIQAISSNSFIIPIILSIIIFKEKFDMKKAVVIVMAIITVILVKI